MIRFEDLLEKVRAYSPDADVELLRRAYVFSAFEHRGQVRHSGEPYLIHPLAVADFLADMKLDAVAIAAGLLHDVVEDTLTTIERIQELFGPEVAHVVEGVTKISAIPFSSSEERQAENFRKMLLAMVDDIRVILVKLADRLHNMRTLNHLPEERRIKIAQETRDIYAPIANRLGMSKVKNELEELSFRYLEPQAYEALRISVDAKRRATEGLIEQLKTHDRRQARRSAGARSSRSTAASSACGASIRSSGGRRSSSSRSTTSSRSRIVTDSVKDCYAALGIIHQTWSPVPGRIKDFIAMPRPNGYQSLHTSVISEHGMPFEVQIRTIEMHRMAEEGIAAHWKYKEGRVGDQRDERYFQWMRQLLEYQQEVRDPQEFIQNLKVDLYPEEVYTFTPKGQVKAFPRGATPIDFAYSIHTDVGQQCVGARVNGKMVPLRVPPQERRHRRDRHLGRPQAEPRLAELRRHLARAVQDQALHSRRGEGARPIDLGRKVFEKEARRYDLNPKTLIDSEAFQSVLGEFGGQKPDDVFAAIGYGKLSPKQVLGKLVPADSLREKAPEGRGHGRRQARARDRRGEDQGPRLRRPHGVPRTLLQSDSRREDRRLHHARQGRVRALATCPNVINLLYDPERRIDVEWDKGRRSRALHREADDGGGGSEGGAGRGQREDRRHQHQHQEHGSAHRRRPARAHRHDRRDQRPQASREGDQVAARQWTG